MADPLSDSKHYTAPLQDLLSALADGLRRRSLLIVVGADVNVAAGLPSLAGLRSVFTEQLRPRYGDRLPDDPLTLADLYATSFGHDALIRSMQEHFSTATAPSGIHQAIASIGSAAHFFTVNCDRLLEMALRNACDKVVRVVIDDADRVAPGEIPVYKLAGALDRPTTLITARSEFMDYRTTHPRIRDRLVTELKERTTIFIGCHPLNPFLDFCVQEAYGVAPGGRAFLVLTDASPADLHLYLRRGLRPVPLGNYERLADLLTKARGAAGAPRRDSAEDSGERFVTATSDPAAPAVAASALRKRFEDLRLRFDLGAGDAILVELDDMARELSALARPNRAGILTRVHLLLRVLLSGRGPGAAQVASEHLRRAEEAGIVDDLNTEHTVVHAMVLGSAGDVDGALALLSSAASEWAIRTRFAISLASGRLAECTALLSETGEGSPALESENGKRLLSLYYADSGDFTQAIDTAGEALDMSRAAHGGRPSAVVLFSAGIVHSRAANSRLGALIAHHNLVPGLIVELDLSSYIDASEDSRAIVLWAEAASAFASVGNEVEATRCYLQCSLPHPAVPDSTREHAEAELRRVPIIGRLVSSALEHDHVAAIGLLKRLRLPLVQQLELVRLVVPPDVADRLSEDLARSTLEGEIDVLTRIQAVGTLLTGYERRGERDEITALVSSLTLPAEYAYIQHLLAFVDSSWRSDRDRARAALRAAIDAAPSNPLVLAVALKRGPDLLGQTPKDAADECTKLARTLVRELPTKEAYELLLYWDLQAGRYGEVLATVDEEGARAILDPWQQRAWRGQALGLLGRISDAAKEMQAAADAEPDALPPEFFAELGRLHALGGHPQLAVLALQKAYRRQPEDPRYLVALATALEESGEQEEAYKLVAERALSFPDDERVQAKLIELELGTGREEAAVEAMARFTQKWPNSEIVRSIGLDEGMGLFRSLQERVGDLWEAYERSAAPAAALCHAAPGRLSFFRFWSDRYERGLPLHVDTGLGAGRADTWAAAGEAPPFIVEFTAALTLWRLFGSEWPDRLDGLDWRLLDLDLLLAEERTRLSGHGLAEYERRSRQTAEWVERHAAAGTLREIPTGEGPDEDAFARPRGIPYLTVAAEVVPSGVHLGPGDLADLLVATRAATPNQVRRLAKYGARLAGDAPPAALRARREIVVDSVALESVAALGDLHWLEDVADTIWMSRLSAQGFSAWRGEAARSVEVRDDFERFCASLQRLYERQQDRVLLLSPEQSELREKPVRMYVGSLVRASQESGRALLTDDAFFHRDIEGLREPGFCSATLLRFLMLRGALPEDDYRSLMDQLLVAGYRWIPLEAEHLPYLAPDSRPWQAGLAMRARHVERHKGADGQWRCEPTGSASRIRSPGEVPAAGAAERTDPRA